MDEEIKRLTDKAVVAGRMEQLNVIVQFIEKQENIIDRNDMKQYLMAIFMEIHTEWLALNDDK